MTSLETRLRHVRSVPITETEAAETTVPVERPCFHVHSVLLCDELNHAVHVYAKHQGVQPATVIAEAVRAYLGIT